MNTSLKILIVGFGSIGQRHYKNLKDFGFKTIGVYDVDQQKIKDAKADAVSTLNTSSVKSFDVVFICNPSSDHIDASLVCAEAGLHLFIEKPLSIKLDQIEQLKKIVEEKKLITMVGCNMRFHPCIDFIKKYLEEKKLGKIYSIKHEFGHYLPSWRPDVDYRLAYGGRNEGIILNDIHEFDLLFWLNDWNSVISKNIFFTRSSNLEIKTEDQGIGTFLFENKVLGMVSCDYLSQHYTRTVRIVGENGNLSWDFNENKVKLETKDTVSEIFYVQNYDINQMYIEEFKYFFKHIQVKETTSNSVHIAESLLRIIISDK
ncbi:MAG: Gfo/Idh/MocA family oxidoreductase [Candidatus Taylorbacteria bacterium]|nr:Gfo/Idh/MocA family oxidoreductase [Candidatus Taylorbacteria bacterium]